MKFVKLLVSLNLKKRIKIKLKDFLRYIDNNCSLSLKNILLAVGYFNYYLYCLYFLKNEI